MNFIFLFNSILLGVGLAMDAFSVSLANGMSEPKMKIKKTAAIAGVFAIFQAIMPMLGWICVHTIAEYFGVFEKCVPWIALVLLLYIGGKMLVGGIKCEDERQEVQRLTPSVLFMQGVATSIDALSVGFTIADYNAPAALAAALIIAAVTFVICLTGLKLGKKAGMKFSDKAEILGGAILIFIGLEIFLTGIF